VPELDARRGGHIREAETDTGGILNTAWGCAGSRQRD